MHVIVAASDAGTRARLRAELRAWVDASDEAIDSPQLLGQRLAARGADEDLLVLTGPGFSDAAGYARTALAQAVPVLIWPQPAAAAARAASNPIAARSARLTTRERQVLELVAHGVSNKGIARRLQVSPNTVKFHLTSLFAKLAVTTRAEAIAAAARRGELSL